MKTACKHSPQISAKSIEKILLRHSIGNFPEVRLVVAMLTRTILDASNHQRDACDFMRSKRLDDWANHVGIEPEFVREVASKAFILTIEPLADLPTPNAHDPEVL
ncbi:hypothetical protein ACFQNF_19665 [Iodobacter arcticus]|uniref:Uncharacterized protein n=1 Tax=Iodobacter arcticus TaxID=590593 RepID=A0ABW2R2Z3_9NEIS